MLDFFAVIDGDKNVTCPGEGAKEKFQTEELDGSATDPTQSRFVENDAWTPPSASSACTSSSIQTQPVSTTSHESTATSTQQQPQQPTSMASGGPSSRMTSSYLRQPTLVKASEKHEIIPNAKLIIPKTAKIYLPPRDDAAEFDDSGPDLRGVVDDEKVVSWRKGNKACVMLSALLDKNIQQGDDAGPRKENTKKNF